jgi:hypothetical protein
MSIEPIEIEEVYKQWLKMSSKKSTDIMDTSAYLLKCLPVEYMSVIIVMFNKCASKGEFFEAGKTAKVICLSKDGIYPSENRLRPISLLPNLSKLFERCIHSKILKSEFLRNSDDLDSSTSQISLIFLYVIGTGGVSTG